jgi:hypothetical protein
MGEKQDRIGRSARSYVLICAFVAATWLPMADMLFGPATARPLSENREMAALPKFGWRPAALKMFVFDLKPYLRDNFGFRPELIHWYHLLKGRLLGASSSPLVLFGKQGWLFYAGEHTVDDYRCVTPYTDEELDGMQRLFEQERDWLAQRGIQYLLVFVPNNHTLYPEFLPDGLTRLRPESRLDQFVDHMRKNSTVELLDLRPALLEAKQKMRVSRRTDSHWTEYGAFIGYQAIMQKLCAWFPAIRPPRIEDFTVVTRMRPGGDLTEMIDAEEERQEESIELVPRAPRRAVQTKIRDTARVNGKLVPAIIVAEVPQPGWPRAVILHDSSGGMRGLMPFLSEDFSRIAFVATRRFQRKVIEAEKPDVVIRQFTERFLILDRGNFLDQDDAP